MKNNILLPFILIFFVACDYPLFTAQKAEAPEIAVSAFFTADSVLRVKVEPVVNAFSNSYEMVNIEKVKVIKRNTDQEFLLQSESDSSGVYTLPDLLPAPGDVLTFEAYVNGYDKPVTATDTVPEGKPDFRLVSTGLTACTPYSFDDNVSLKPSAVFRFMPNRMRRVSYYEFLVDVTEYGAGGAYYYSDAEKVYLATTSSLITAEDYYPSNPVVDELGPLSLLFKCKDITDSVTIDFSYYTSLFGDFDSLYTSNHDLRIELREVSYSYYKYKTTYYCQKYAIDGNYFYGMPAPVAVYSNLENGAGIFAAYNSLSTTYYVKAKGVRPQ